MNIHWETPQDFFHEIDKEFRFDIDVCAVESDAKVKKFFNPDVDGLSAVWEGVCWCNPPYNKTIGNWVQKAYNSAQDGATVICLLPGRSSDTKWFHAYIMKSSEIRFIKGRIQFLHNGKHGQGSSISNIIVVFRPYCTGPPVVSAIDKLGRPYNQQIQRTQKVAPLILFRYASRLKK